MQTTILKVRRTPHSGTRLMTNAAPPADRGCRQSAPTRTLIASILTVLVAGMLARPDAAQEAAPWTPAEIERFLQTAEIVGARPIEKGVTNSWRLTLSDGTTTHDAAFQSINQRKSVARVGGRTELRFADSYHFNIAAYRLARFLELDDMVPVSVERRWQRRVGALTWWIDAEWDESERKAAQLRPPDIAAWSKQLYQMVIFAELIHDTDRNKGNIRYTTDWRLWMIDFTRAFRVWPELPHPQALVACSPVLAKRLAMLDKQGLVAVMDGHLTPTEMDAILDRRDLILQRFEMLKTRVPGD